MICKESGIWLIWYDAVEQGLMELRKLDFERRLWEASRKEIEQENGPKSGA